MTKRINKVNVDFTVVSLDNKDGLIVKNKNALITIYDEKLKEKFFAKSFMKEYRHLLYLLMNLPEDNSESNMAIIRDKIAEVRNRLIFKYRHKINKELLNKYLKMLMLLESKINIPNKSKNR